MPKLKSSAKKRRGEIIDAWKRHRDITDDKAAAMLGISLSTLKRRRAAGDWGIEELHRAITAFRIPPQDALELLTIGCFVMERHMESERKNRHGT